tara:strand:- start:730 stop:1017 length:288 start_codon:yes stop_codon:yes gene_type:complete
MVNIILTKLKIIFKKSGLKQKKIAKILGINEIHLSKIMNGKASLTQKMAHNLAMISELNTTEQEILYPFIENDQKKKKNQLIKITKPKYFGCLIY